MFHFKAECSKILSNAKHPRSLNNSIKNYCQFLSPIKKIPKHMTLCTIQSCAINVYLQSDQKHCLMVHTLEFCLMGVYGISIQQEKSISYQLGTETCHTHFIPSTTRTAAAAATTTATTTATTAATTTITTTATATTTTATTTTATTTTTASATTTTTAAALVTRTSTATIATTATATAKTKLFDH